MGSAPPTGKVTGDTVGSIKGAIDEMIRPVMTESTHPTWSSALTSLTLPDKEYQCKAAIDIALHDIWARSVKQPVWRLFGGSGKQLKQMSQ